MKNSWVNRVFALVAATMGTSCHPQQKQPAAPSLAALGGTNWISQAYLDSLDVNGTPASLVATSCLELVFSAGFDSLAAIESGKHVAVYALYPQSDASFLAKGDGNLAGTFRLDDRGRDLAYEGPGPAVPFRALEKKYAATTTDGWRTGTVLFLNERLLAAQYRLLNPLNEPTATVVFSSYGEVAGLADYKRYSICLDSACFPGAGEDLIELSDRNALDRYIWKWQNDTLVFYSLRMMGTPASGHYSRGPEIFRFVKSR